MRWLLRVIDRYSRRTQERELRYFVQKLRAMDGAELGVVVANATNMRNSLEANGSNVSDPALYFQRDPTFPMQLNIRCRVILSSSASGVSPPLVMR
jgi:hypothetical protein